MRIAQSSRTSTRVEHHVDLVLKNMKLKILGQLRDEVLSMTDSRHKFHKANEDCKIVRNDLLITKSFGETGSVKYK